MMIEASTIEDVLNFWFTEVEPKQRFQKDKSFDELVTKKFLPLLEKAKACYLKVWEETPKGSLAKIILLDQFSRNIFRDSTEAFSNDTEARRIARAAIDRGFDRDLNTDEKAFLYMPFMHSETKEDHELAVRLFSQKGLETYLDFECQHKNIIDRFGRYPHRNKILGRHSTEEELEFLKTENSSF